MHNILNNLIRTFGLLALLLLAPLAQAAPTITSQSHTNFFNVNYGSSLTMSVVASGTGSLSYQWYKGGISISGATSASYAVPYVDDTTHQNHFVRITDSTGSVDSLAFIPVVQNIPPLAFVSQPSHSNQTVAAGGSVIYHFTMSGGMGGLTSQKVYVSSSGAEVNAFFVTLTRGSNGLHTGTISMPSVGASQGGTFYLRMVSSLYGTATSSTFSLTVDTSNLAPVITVQPVNRTFEAGDAAQLSVTATGSGLSLSYQWKKDGVNASGATATAATYLAHPFTAAHIGSYTVTVTNSHGSVISNAVTLGMALPVFQTQPTDMAVVPGATASFSIGVTNPGSHMSYQWKKDGVAIAGTAATQTTYSFTAAADSGGVYTCTATNGGGSVTSNPATLTINLPVPVIITQPVNRVVNAGTGTSFSVSATTAFLGNLAGIQFQWKKNGVNVGPLQTPLFPSSTFSIPSASSADMGTYTVVLSNGYGSVTSNAATLTVNVPPTITTQPANQVVNAGSPATFTVVATGTDLTYQWKKDGTNIVGATSATYSIPTTSAGSAGSYTVTVANSAGNVTSNAAVLTVDAAPVPPTIATQPANQVVNAGSPATFTVVATGTDLTYQWKKDGTNIVGATSATYSIPTTSAGSAGSYTVTVANSAGNVTSNAAVLTVNAAPVPPTITTQPSSQAVTAGSSALFLVTATGDATLTYQWKKDGTNIVGATSATYSIPTASAGSAGSYTVTVANSAGNVTSNAAVLTVNAAPVPPTITTQPANQVVNAGSPATFTVVATGTDLTYQWFRNGISLSGATLASYTIATTSAASAGSYTVTVSNTLSDVTSNAATLTVLPVFPAPAAAGYAASVTGGGAATTTNHTVVTTAAEFRTLAESTAASAAVITVSGTLNLGATKVAVKSNKTIQGLDASATLVGNLELASGVSNVVIRGLNISNTAGAGVTLTGATNVYITHVTFFDCSDTLLRIVGGSDNVTVSWCEFYFTATTGTRQALLIGATTGETKAIKATLSHNWFTDRVDQQQPDSTWGQVHAYNNSFNPNGTANTSGTIMRANAQLLSERNQYTSIVSPLTKTGGGLIRAIGNAYSTTTGTAADAGTDTVFTPSYSYRLLPVASVASQIAALAGNTAGAGSTSASTGSSSINASGTAITTGSSFTLTCVTPISSTTAYQWRLNNADIAGATSSTYTVASAQMANAGTYTVVSSNSAGDSLVSSPVTITVGAAPSNPPASGGGGGGGSPSLWFIAALAALAALKRLTRKS